jgi:putative ABC transport system permease protein
LRPNGGGYAFIRTEPGKTALALAGIEALHQKLNPDFAFAHQFADEEYAMQYTSEQVAQRLSQYSAFLSIFISSLGLLGLVIFTAEQRVKEVGIRKVLGASVMQIVTLLSRDFMKLVTMAILIALPIAWYVSDNWLKSFEYNIGVQWWMPGGAAAGAVLIALITISFHAIRAGMENPVKSLKAE